MDVDLTTSEVVASDRAAWRQTVQKGLFSFEQSLAQQAEAKRKRRKARGQADRPATDFPVTPDRDAALVSPPRAQLHSLLRLTNAH